MSERETENHSLHLWKSYSETFSGLSVRRRILRSNSRSAILADRECEPACIPRWTQEPGGSWGSLR